MYERFTDRARKVMQLANEEAQRFNHVYLGPEHILLGLSTETTGVAGIVLKNLQVGSRQLRKEIERLLSHETGRPAMPEAKRVIEAAIEHARQLGHKYVGTEHLLLGVASRRDSLAERALRNLGIGFDRILAEILSLVGASEDKEPANQDRNFNQATSLRLASAITLLEKIAELLRHLKEDAIAQQDFVRAATFRDYADDLLKIRDGLRGESLPPDESKP